MGYLNSSRIRKPASASLRRHSSSPFSGATRVKPSIQRAKSLAEAYVKANAADNDGEDEDDRLDATGVTLSIMPDPAVVDVLSAMRHATESMFCSIPERAGMNSTRIAEVLNFQKNLPPLVSLAHVHALISASSKTEREISTLIASGEIRRIKVAGRGNDISGASDFLMTTASLQKLLHDSGIAADVSDNYLHLLKQHPRATSLPSGLLSPTHITALTKAGFLVSTSSITRNLSLSGSSLTATSAISRAFSGSSGAVGGEAAFENLGGVGSAKRFTSSASSSSTAHLLVSVPNIGAYIRLLNAGRAHLVELLNKSSYKEAPMYLLRERWDGAVDGESSASKARMVRGVFSEVMPAKTKKWRNLWGLRFVWALEECLGTGMVEGFETGSVGLGVRALR